MAEPTTVPVPPTPAARPGLVGWARTLTAKVLLEPISTGRLRDLAWPPGLRPVVALALLAYVVCAGVVVLSSAIRRGAELSVSATGSASMPRPYVWLLILTVLVALSLFQTATLHASWWLRVVGVLASLIVMATWGIRSTSVGGGLVETALTVAAMLALLALVVLRARRGFSWWEFPVVLLVLGTPVVAGIELLSRSARPLGYDFVPTYLQSTMTSLAPVALPAAAAAGLSVAEITASATLWATRLTGRFAARRLAYGILLALLALRVGQAIWQLATWDFIEQRWNVLATWTGAALVLAALSVLMIRLGNRRADLEIGSMPDRMGSMALPLGAGLVGMAFAAVLVVSVFGVAGAVAPETVGAMSGAWLDIFASDVGPHISRIVLATVLLVLAVRFARRGAPVPGMLLTAVAVMLLARVTRWATGGVADAGSGPSAPLSLVTLVAVLGAIAWCLGRRRLTPQRAVTLSGALVLSALLGVHDLVADPVGTLIGLSGAGLVLFGLTWDMLTDSARANTGSRRYPVPARVMMLLANSVLAIAMLAYTSLVRDPGATVNLEDFAALGDEILGTALLAATFVALLVAVRENRPAE